MENVENKPKEELEEGGSILDKIITNQSRIQENGEPAEVVEEILKELEEREAQIIQRRFGLNNNKIETLQTIGRSYNITRERVRQIERLSIVKIKNSSLYGRLISPWENFIYHTIEEHGGIIPEDYLLEKLVSNLGSRGNNQAALIFIISSLSNRFKEIKDSKKYNQSWCLKIFSFDLYDQVVNEAVNIFNEVKKPLSFEELAQDIKKTELFNKYADLLTDNCLYSFLSVTKKIKENPFSEWGLATWSIVTPKRMNDKIYLVLKKEGKPLHFDDIAKKINEIKFDKKVAHPATIHNELILDNRYVLVGRGIYALKEWGYKKGAVADVLVDVLKTVGKPLSKNELVERVLKQRMVKKSTIYLAMTDKTKFKKLPDGKYELVESI